MSKIVNNTVDRLCEPFNPDSEQSAFMQLEESFKHMQEQLDFLCWAASLSIDSSQVSECRKCGHFIKLSDNFCGNCGTVIETDKS